MKIQLNFELFKSKLIYREPIQQHANLLKSHNLSLNNFKTEIRLPNAQKFLNETQFIKSPFLSKTLKGMMMGAPAKKSTNNANNYGRIGNIGTRLDFYLFYIFLNYFKLLL